VIRKGTFLPSFLAIGVAAAAVPQGPASKPAPAGPRERLAGLSQRLEAGDLAAIDELLACTPPASPDETPSPAEIERLKQDLVRLRAAAPLPPSPEAAVGSPVAIPRDPEASVREARAWMRAGDPIRCLNAISSTPATGGPIDGEVAYWQACALEKLGRDAEALAQYRRAGDLVLSPVLRQAAASGADHVAWRLRRSGSREENP